MQSVQDLNSCPIPATITITPRAPPKFLVISSTSPCPLMATESKKTKTDKYLNVARELKKALEHEGDCDTNYKWYT